MPWDPSRYPPAWFTRIRPAIMRRAGQKRDKDSGAILVEARCERCRVENHSLVFRDWKQGWTRVVLTIAHIGAPVLGPDGIWRPGDKHDKYDIRAENLAALCQKCHLLEDIDDHVQHRRENLARKRQEAVQAAGQLDLFEAV